MKLGQKSTHQPATSDLSPPLIMGVEQLETSDFFTYFKGRNREIITYHWISCTWAAPIPKGLSKADKGDLKVALKKHFGRSAIGSIFPHFNVYSVLILLVVVEGKIWTNEDVFWQNHLIDRHIYKVAYSTPFLHGD
jgi:hypothetical protein